MGNSICWYFLVKCTQLFPRFHSQKPRTNLPSCIQIPIALSLSLTDIPCEPILSSPIGCNKVAERIDFDYKFSLLCFAITGPLIECRSTLPNPRQHLLVRNSEIVTTSILLDSRCCWISFTGPLQPFPPRTLPKLCGRNPGFPNKTTLCRSLMSAVIPGDVELFEVSQAGDDEEDEDDEGSSVTGVVGKKRPSDVL